MDPELDSSVYSFSTVQVSKLTGLSLRQLDYWAQYKIFVPSIQQSHGSGSRKLYSVDDVIQLRSLSKLKCFRWSTQKLHTAISALRDVMADSNPLRQAMLFGGHGCLIVVCKSEAGERLFFDGLTKGNQQVLGLVLETLEEETKRAIAQFLNLK